jgi:hypothetical protein
MDPKLRFHLMRKGARLADYLERIKQHADRALATVGSRDDDAARAPCVSSHLDEIGANLDGARHELSTGVRREGDDQAGGFTVYIRRSKSTAENWEHWGHREDLTSLEEVLGELTSDEVPVIAVPGCHYDDPPIPIEVNVDGGEV